jgi:hypothetical protein
MAKNSFKMFHTLFDTLQTYKAFVEYKPGACTAKVVTAVINSVLS